MTRKTTKAGSAPAPTSTGQASPTLEAPANQRQRSVLIIMGICLAVMFFTSFLFRMQTPGLQVERPTAQQSAKSAPAADMEAAQSMPPGMGAGKPGAMPGGMPQAGEMSSESMAAIGELMRKMSEKPNDPKLLFELGERFMAANSFEKAAVFFSRALVSEPGNIEIIDNLGVCMFELGRYQDASGYFAQITTLEKDNAQAFLNLGVLNKLMGKPEDAKQFFQTVIDLPKASDALKAKAKTQIEDLKTHGAAPAQEKQPESKANHPK